MKLSPTNRMLLAILSTSGDELERWWEQGIADYLNVTRTTVHKNLIKLVQAGLVEVQSRYCSFSGQRDTRFRLTNSGVTALGGFQAELHSDVLEEIKIDHSYAFGPPKDWNPLEKAMIMIPEWCGPGWHTMSIEEYQRRVENSDVSGLY